MTKQEENIIKKYIEERKPIIDIMKEEHLSFYTIKQILLNNNIQLRTRQEFTRKYNLNEHFLDEINTEEKVYFLGFFMADGYNGIHRRALSITLNEDDMDILENFKRIFEYEGKIIHHKAKMNNNGYLIRPTVSLEMSSIYLNNRLIELGCPPNKSLSLEFPDYISDNLLKHFIRGYFDGDGCIYLKDKKHNYLGVKIIICDKFANVFVQKMKENGFNFNIQSPKECNEHTKNVYLSKQKDVKAFLDWIYQNSSIRCERKYQRYYNFYYGDGNITPYKIPTGKILSSENKNN